MLTSSAIFIQYTIIQLNMHWLWVNHMCHNENVEELFSSTFMPALHRQTSKQFKIYSTLEKDVWYTTGKRGRSSKVRAPAKIHKIGQINIQMPDLTGDKGRKIDVMFDFTHTEIHVKAYDHTSRNEVKVVLDYLHEL